MRTKLVITKDGHCTWQAPVTLNSYCTLDISEFPFDEQKCPVEIGSWTYPGEKINITYSDRNADLNYYIKSGEWTLQSATLSQDFGFYSPENTPHPHVTLSLKIKRRAGYYKNQIIIPLAAISIMAIYSFILPLNVEDRLMIVITIVVAISVYGVIVSSALPETSDATPALQKYCLWILLLVVVTSVHVIPTSLLEQRASRFFWIWKQIKKICPCRKCKNNASGGNTAVKRKRETGGGSLEMDAGINQEGSVSENREVLDNNAERLEIVETGVRMLCLIIFLALFFAFLFCWAS